MQHNEVGRSSNSPLLLLLLNRFSRVRLCATHRRQPTRHLCPWDSPGKNTGVGCHFLLQCMKVKSESDVDQSCPTLSDPMDWSLPGSSIHGIFQARVLEWGVIAFSIQLSIIYATNSKLIKDLNLRTKTVNSKKKTQGKTFMIVYQAMTSWI